MKERMDDWKKRFEKELGRKYVCPIRHRESLIIC